MPQSSSAADRWQVVSTKNAIPHHPRLASVARELELRAREWDVFTARDPESGAVVETLASFELAWQAHGDEFRMGAWDSKKQILWLAGGSPVTLMGEQVDALAASRGKRGVELRRHSRVEVRLEVQICNAGLSAFTKDLSHGGAFLEISGQVEKDQQLLLSLQPQGSEQPLFVQVEVVRVANDGVGVRFVHTDDRQRQEVARIVERAMRGAQAAA